MTNFGHYSSTASLHEELVRTVEAVHGVARLVPSYREMLSKTARKLFGGESDERSDAYIVTQGRTETCIYIDVFAQRGYETGRLADDIIDAVQGTFLRHRTSTPAPECLPQQERININVRVLSVDSAP